MSPLHWSARALTAVDDWGQDLNLDGKVNGRGWPRNYEDVGITYRKDEYY